MKHQHNTRSCSSSRSRSWSFEGGEEEEEEDGVRLMKIEDIKDKNLRNGCLLPLEILKGLARIAAHQLSQESNFIKRPNTERPSKRPMAMAMASSTSTHNHKKLRSDDGQQKLHFSAIKTADKSRVACYRSRVIIQDQATFVVNNPTSGSGTNATLLVKKEQATCEFKKRGFEIKIQRKEETYKSHRSPKREKRRSHCNLKRETRSHEERAEKGEKIPDMPEGVEEMIKELEGSNIRLVIQKALSNTDTTRNHNRLSVPMLRIIGEFLTEEEKEIVDMKDYISVKLIDPGLKVYDLKFTRWNMKKPNGQASSLYVLNGQWSAVVEANQFKAGDEIQLWSFRQHSTLCFALVLLGQSNDQQPDSTTQGTTTDATNQNNSATESKQEDSPGEEHTI